MKKATYILIVVIICSCKSKTESFTFEEEGLKVKGQLINGKKEGIFKRYYSNGMIESIRIYKKDELEETSTEFNENGDTAMNFIDQKMYEYFRINKKLSISSIYVPNFTSKINEGIFFDSTAHIRLLNSDLKFLSKQDSNRLSKDYPDWQEQIKAWELKERP